MIPMIYKGMCPNCEDEIRSERLEVGVCEKCLPIDKKLEKLELCKNLKKEKTLKNLEKYCSVWNEFKKFEEFVKRLGFELLSIQKMWAKRVLKNKSFSIVAPTGVGKSFFGIIMSLYLTKKGKKCYIILPTTLLVKQTHDRILSLIEKCKLNINVISYHSDLSTKEKKEAKEKIENGDYDLLITTSNYLAKNDINNKFDFIFVDDVDSLLKASKNIDKTLKLLGFDEELIKEAYKIIYLIKIGKIEEALKKREELKRKVSNINHGCLIIASATGKSYGDKVKLYRELLDFEIGFGMNKLRDVEDIYDEEFKKEEVLEYIKIFGSGGLVFVPIDYGVEKAEEIEKYLLENNIKAKLIYSKDKKGFEEFRKGEIDVLIGVASYYGVLVRGLDMPERVRYAVFYGIPKFKIKLKEYIDKLIEKGVLKENIDIENKSEDEIRHIVKEKLKMKNFSIKLENGEYFILIPDVKTYIQASGRTSRMTEFGLTKGASIVLVDDKDIFEYLRKYMLFMYESEFKKIDEVDIRELIKKIDEDREKIKSGRSSGKTPDLLKSVLMVVESPNKARTIANFFGKPSVRKIKNRNVYEVCVGDLNLLITASGGHVFDLVTKEGFYGVKIEDNIYIPIYASIKKVNGEQFTDQKDLEDVIKQLMEKGEKITNIIDAKDNIEIIREIADEVDALFIATDIDTEGEKIGYDIALNALPFNSEIYRVGFNEITKRAILRAVESFKKGEELSLDENKVKGQIVRRIEDRWIGFRLSQKLWEVFNKNYLSAGRVQTPVLGWIIERYNEHKIKVPYLSLKLEGDIYIGKIWEGEFDKEEVSVETTTYEKELPPMPPFTTDTLLEEATKRYHIGTDEIMSIAQDLFELGLCLTPDTHIVLGDGRIKTIEEIVKSREKKEILSLDLDRKSIICDKIISFWEIKFSGNLKKITLQNNYEIKATPDHHILTLKDGRLKWIPAKNIKEGDYVVMPFNYNYKIRRSHPPSKIFEKIKKIVEIDNFNDVREPEFWYNLGLLFGNDRLSLQGSEKEHLVEELFSLKEDYINAFIAGYLDARGTFLKRGKEINIATFSKNKSILEKIGIYLHSIGILTMIQEHNGYFLVIDNKFLTTFTEKIVKYTKTKNLKEFCRTVIENKNKNKNVKKSNKKIKVGNIYNDVIFIKVKKVEDLFYDGYVYDLSIKCNENFISNGIISHNCTYHRTSSTRVSIDGMKVAREYLKLNNLEHYIKNRDYFMEGAHECIRPTKPMDTDELIEFLRENNIKLTKNHIKIYDLIFRRFIASQTKEAILEYEEIYIKDLDEKIEGYVDIKFDGWSRFYPLKLKKLPKIEKNSLKVLEKKLIKVPKVPLYDEGEVIKLMKERGIGRPSTYAQIIKKLLDRKYVIKSKDKNKLIPTKLGIEVYNFLIENYPHLISEERTRDLEEIMDKIERGEVDYLEVLKVLHEEILSIE
ncbi:reverse gyrase [Methanocaldococcus vulcanius M7]|uniref:Reverse gyrase n=1 Tax=Methanocaldococcus vulcanius (strain ATCC 700851 / DSM 12094 / M7) TaxID=579137 RepID=C9RHR6_METVM|nr:reverse gyrase [Methanocaldococcus vulcanius]ACX73118.1 reverse gyrase [Methanocaldococcus vulcanius M7]